MCSSPCLWVMLQSQQYQPYHIPINAYNHSPRHRIILSKTELYKSVLYMRGSTICLCTLVWLLDTFFCMVDGGGKKWVSHLIGSKRIKSPVIHSRLECISMNHWLYNVNICKLYFWIHINSIELDMYFSFNGKIILTEYSKFWKKIFNLLPIYIS